MDQNLPIYLQISQFIENEILNGRLKLEDQAPSTNEFSKLMQVNPATAGKGLNELVTQGILYKKRGLGMFVTAEAEAIIIKKRKEAFKQQMFPELVKEAKRINMTKEELIELVEENFHA